jgi:hypothetical protein
MDIRIILAFLFLLITGCSNNPYFYTPIEKNYNQNQYTIYDYNSANDTRSGVVIQNYATDNYQVKSIKKEKIEYKHTAPLIFRLGE